MNPHYRVQIDVCLVHPKAGDHIWLRRIGNLPFVPSEGQVMRFTNDSEDQTLDITLDNVVYDTAGGMFVSEISDETACETYKNQGSTHTSELLANYLPFGFTRLNVATAQAMKA